MIRISIYDDHKARREGLEAFVELSPNLALAGSHFNCAHIEDDLKRDMPDIILMDIEMPEVNGIEGIIRVKKVSPEIKVIVQTAFDDDDWVFAAMRAGAEGYVLKSADIRQLSQGIDEVINGGAMMSPSIALKVIRHFESQNLPITPPDYQLTPKEREVLRLLMAGRSYKMVADEMCISYFTVNNHVKKIYQKLQVHSLAEAVARGHKEGLFG